MKPQQIKKLQQEFEEKQQIPVVDIRQHNLDLGVSPLQRIIDEMKSLTSDAPAEACTSEAARAAGVVRYCDYLVGNVNPERY